MPQSVFLSANFVDLGRGLGLHLFLSYVIQVQFRVFFLFSVFSELVFVHAQ